MITKYLPSFKVMEVNNLTGLRSGHMLSQVKVGTDIAKVAKGNLSFIENGIIVGLSADGTIENFDVTKHGCAFVHFTEELNTVLSGLEYFAVPVEDETYIRAIALYVGDTFTTNNHSAVVEGETYVAAKVVDGVLTLQTAADDDSMFIVAKSDLPNGDDAYEFTFYKMAMAKAAE